MREEREKEIIADCVGEVVCTETAIVPLVLNEKPYILIFSISFEAN